MTVQEQVRRFVLESFYVGDPDELTDDVSLIDSGIVDSTGMLEVILFLEGEYGFHVEDSETVPENLETLDQIAAYVARKRAAAAG
jgi:acyl carrier protein